MVISTGTRLKKKSSPIHGKNKTKQTNKQKNSQQNRYRRNQLQHNKEHIENPQLTS